MDEVAKSTPDGYTLLLVHSGLTYMPGIYRTLPFDPVKDFDGIVITVTGIYVLAVNPAMPVKSVAELIAYAKANPGKLSIASGNTAGIVGAKTLAHDASIDLLHVPYKSSPQAIEDVIAGRVSMMIVDFTVGMPHASAGQVRALAMTRLKRSALYPDLPTMDEAGIEGFGLDAWAGLVAPANTPPEVIARLNGALRKVIDNPDVQAKFKNVGFDAFSSTPEEFGAFIKAQLGIWSKMVKDANIQAE
jgi:tripartite-type tricarboxylate transporter receptor subunit TctC